MKQSLKKMFLLLILGVISRLDAAMQQAFPLTHRERDAVPGWTSAMSTYEDPQSWGDSRTWQQNEPGEDEGRKKIVGAKKGLDVFEGTLRRAEQADAMRTTRRNQEMASRREDIGEQLSILQNALNNLDLPIKMLQSSLAKLNVMVLQAELARVEASAAATAITPEKRKKAKKEQKEDKKRAAVAARPAGKKKAAKKSKSPKRVEKKAAARKRN